MAVATYFVLLPDVIIEEIVRYISDRPRHPKWKAYLGESNAYNLVEYESPIKKFVTPLLNHLTATNDNFARGNIDTLVVRGASRGLPKFLSVVLEEVHLRAIPLDSSWVRQLTARCLALRSLEVHYAMPSAHFVSMLEARGEGLKSLSAWFVGSRQQLEAISKYCLNLESLELQYLRRASLDLWRIIGNSIQCLTLSFSIAMRPVETIRHVQSHCRKIIKLNVLENYNGFDQQASSAVSELYSSYGKQILEASFKDVDPSFCKDIKRLCPNMTCSAGHMHHVLDQMNILGDKIRDLRVDFHGDSYSGYDDQFFKLAASRCTKIESLSTRSSLLTCMWSSKFFRVFFEKKKEYLKILDWSEILPTDFHEESLQLLSWGTSSLENITLSLGCLKSSGFQSLVRNNPKIKKVELRFVRPNLQHVNESSDAEKILVDILHIFMSLRNLKYFAIDIDGDNCLISEIRQIRSLIRNECVKYRNRNTFVIIAGVEYLS